MSGFCQLQFRFDSDQSTEANGQNLADGKNAKSRETKGLSNDFL